MQCTCAISVIKLLYSKDEQFVTTGSPHRPLESHNLTAVPNYIWPSIKLTINALTFIIIHSYVCK